MCVDPLSTRCGFYPWCDLVFHNDHVVVTQSFYCRAHGSHSCAAGNVASVPQAATIINFLPESIGDQGLMLIACILCQQSQLVYDSVLAAKFRCSWLGLDFIGGSRRLRDGFKRCSKMRDLLAAQSCCCAHRVRPQNPP